MILPKTSVKQLCMIIFQKIVVLYSNKISSTKKIFGIFNLYVYLSFIENIKTNFHLTRFMRFSAYLTGVRTLTGDVFCT